MEELIRTNNPVEISLIRARLEEAEIPFLLADEFTSIVDGSIGAIPRRFLVAAEDLNQARGLIDDVLKGS